MTGSVLGASMGADAGFIQMRSNLDHLSQLHSRRRIPA